MRTWGWWASGAFIVLGVAVSAGGTDRLDQALLPLLRAPAGSVLARLAYGLTQAGMFPAVAATASLWALLRWRSDRTGAWVGLALAAASGALTWALKALWDRPRPEGMLYTPTGTSFPSGHALTGLLFFGGVAWWWGRSRPRPARWTSAGVAFGLAIGVTRWILGVHYVSDVLAGWLVAAAGLAVLADLPERGAVGDEPAVEARVGPDAVEDHGGPGQ